MGYYNINSMFRWLHKVVVSYYCLIYFVGTVLKVSRLGWTRQRLTFKVGKDKVGYVGKVE